MNFRSKSTTWTVLLSGVWYHQQSNPELFVACPAAAYSPACGFSLVLVRAGFGLCTLPRQGSAAWVEEA